MNGGAVASAEEKHRSGLNPEEYRKLTGFEGDWRDSWWADDFLAVMVTRWRVEAARKVLDVGCGVGHWGQRLMRFLPDAHLTGIDAEPTWMDEARGRASRLGVDATYSVANAASLPFDDDSFDLVTCQTLLMHVPDPVAVLREMHRVARPGATVVAAEPNNFANVAARCMALPEAPFSVSRDLLELHHTLTAGKSALGEGDQSVGEKLPHYFEKAGLGAVQVSMNPQTAPSLPPYGPTRGGRDIAMLREWTAEGRLMEMGGTVENARRMFLAGGGTESRFEELLAVAFKVQERTVAAFDASEYVSSGGHLHYLVSGLKAAASAPR